MVCTHVRSWGLIILNNYNNIHHMGRKKWLGGAIATSVVYSDNEGEQGKYKVLGWCV